MSLRPSSRAALPLVLFAGAVSAAACSVYDSSLLDGNGGSGAGAGGAMVTSTSTGQGGATTSTSATGGGGSSTTTTSSTSTTTTTTTTTGGGCQSPSDCPGNDDECTTRTCADGVCGVDLTAAGTALAQQTAGDCKRAECDGSGGVTDASDDGDTPDDGKECTTDACDQGAPTSTPVAPGTACSQNGGHVCNAAGDCVECVAPADCASHVCDPVTFTCSAPGCGDGVENGDETDVDCGGSCGACATGKQCTVGADCIGGVCTNGTCAATCSDTVQNQTETDVDCGGSCPACGLGKACGANADCGSQLCVSTQCVAPIKISEVQTRGPQGGNDDYVELYNPTNGPVTLDASWKLWSRSWDTGSYVVRWTGSGTVIPAHGHVLLANSSYAGAVAGDASLSTGIKDAGSLVLGHPALTDVVDALCYYYSASSLSAVSGPTFTCEGAPIDNSPHNDSSGNVALSVERKPGGANGNGTDTGDNSSDFIPAASNASNPQNAASAPTP